MRASVKAHTNIALIKYWGKRDEQLFLPTNNSLSVTLDKFYTITTVEFDELLQSDQFFLNGKQAESNEMKKVAQFLDRVRTKANRTIYAKVDSENHVPTAAGFASSASGYAALAAASAKAIGLNLNQRELSQLARQGSGSASRSIFGGYVEWNKGIEEDGSDCYAAPILDTDAWDLRVLSVEVTTKAKKVLSRAGMKRTVETSPFFAGWLEAVEEDLITIKQALQERDFTKLGQVVEANALKMHATTLGANPPFMYWQSATVEVMQEVQALRERGIEAYFTIDAGPNVKVVCQPEDEQKIHDALAFLHVVHDIHHCRVGPGITYLTD
ncbi:Homoserine kinase [Paraliobacillus sp. PM-2]|uniref:diphosphomevalonate decarboxylase n=1 Tax=Paraliobacillus sp. PM-2 TaxID=1462524 RepID=UPI00061C4008|nr:diphosphomevalonate decarboxylase [Paraliobacillus sp. PM-2]CQR48431.1 Homoserine kinase [Paraliobacillus sp. PM-2]